jgi:hypothetical protein
MQKSEGEKITGEIDADITFTGHRTLAHSLCLIYKRSQLLEDRTSRDPISTSFASSAW